MRQNPPDPAACPHVLPVIRRRPPIARWLGLVVAAVSIGMPGMAQGLTCHSFTPEARNSPWITSHFLWQKLQSYITAQLTITGKPHFPHASASDFSLQQKAITKDLQSRRIAFRRSNIRWLIKWIVHINCMAYSPNIFTNNSPSLSR